MSIWLFLLLAGWTIYFGVMGNVYAYYEYRSTTSEEEAYYHEASNWYILLGSAPFIGICISWVLNNHFQS